MKKTKLELLKIFLDMLKNSKTDITPKTSKVKTSINLKLNNKKSKKNKNTEVENLFLKLVEIILLQNFFYLICIF